MRLPLRALPLIVVESARDAYQLLLLAILVVGLIYALVTGDTVGTKLLAASVSPMLAVLAFRYYLNYRIIIESDAIHLSRGVMSRFEDSIRFERIERISQEQNLFQQIMGLKTLRLHTLGDGDKTLDLVQLTNTQSDAIISAIPGVTLEHSISAKTVSPWRLFKAFFILPSFKIRSFVLGVMIVALFSAGIDQQTQKMDEAQDSAASADWSNIDIRTVEGALVFSPRAIETMPQMVSGVILVFTFAAVMGKMFLFLIAYFPFRWHIDADNIIRFEHGSFIKHRWALRPNDISFVTVYHAKGVRNPDTFVLQLTSIGNTSKPAILPGVSRSQMNRIIQALGIQDPTSDGKHITSNQWGEIRLIAAIGVMVGVSVALCLSLLTPNNIISIDWQSWLYGLPGIAALLVILLLIRSFSNRITFNGDSIAIGLRSIYGETVIFGIKSLSFVDCVRSPVEGERLSSWGFHVGERRFKVAFLPASDDCLVDLMKNIAMADRSQLPHA